MKKSRASLEPFWDSKISKYLMRVSSEYIHYKLSATFSEKHCWLNFTCFLGLRNALCYIYIWGQHRSMCTHCIDDLLPHAPLHCAATGEMVKGS